jgi:hypothetical protein
MLDILRNLTRSTEEKRQEQLNAYLDGELRGAARGQFEARLAAEPELRAELSQLRAVKQGVGQLPRLRAPRNYTLDPAVYGRPVPARSPALYPALRLATVLTAFLLVIALGLELAPGTEVASDSAEAPVALFETTVAEEVAMEEAEESTAMTAPEEPAGQEADQAAERSAADEAAPAEVMDTAVITATETMTDDASTLALPAPEAEDVEEEAEEAFEETEMPAAGAAAPLEPEATQLAEEALEAAPLPVAPTPTPEPPVVAAQKGVGLEPLRIAQAVLGVTLVILLTATLLVRRQTG